MNAATLDTLQQETTPERLVRICKLTDSHVVVTTQDDSEGTPAAGLLIYDTTGRLVREIFWKVAASASCPCGVASFGRSPFGQSSLSGVRIVVGDQLGCSGVWAADTGEKLLQFISSPQVCCAACFPEWNREVFLGGFETYGQSSVSTFRGETIGDYDVRRYDATKPEIAGLLPGHAGIVVGLTADLRTGSLFTGSQAGEIFVWDRKNWKTTAMMGVGDDVGTMGSVFGCFFDETQRLLLVGRSGGAVDVWDSRKLSEMHSCFKLKDPSDVYGFARLDRNRILVSSKEISSWVPSSSPSGWKCTQTRSRGSWVFDLCPIGTQYDRPPMIERDPEMDTRAEYVLERDKEIRLARVRVAARPEMVAPWSFLSQ